MPSPLRIEGNIQTVKEQVIVGKAADLIKFGRMKG